MEVTFSGGRRERGWIWDDDDDDRWWWWWWRWRWWWWWWWAENFQRKTPSCFNFARTCFTKVRQIDLHGSPCHARFLAALATVWLLLLLVIAVNGMTTHWGFRLDQSGLGHSDKLAKSKKKLHEFDWCMNSELANSANQILPTVIPLFYQFLFCFFQFQPSINISNFVKLPRCWLLRHNSEVNQCPMDS